MAHNSTDDPTHISLDDQIKHAGRLRQWSNEPIDDAILASLQRLKMLDGTYAAAVDRSNKAIRNFATTAGEHMFKDIVDAIGKVSRTDKTITFDDSESSSDHWRKVPFYTRWLPPWRKKHIE